MIVSLGAPRATRQPRNLIETLRAVTNFLIDLLFGVSYLFYTFCIGGLTLLALSVTTAFLQRGGAVVSAGLRSGFDPVAVWLCRTRVSDFHLCLLISPIIVL